MNFSIPLMQSVRQWLAQSLGNTFGHSLGQSWGQSWGQSMANTLAIFLIAFVAGGCVSTMRVPQQAGGPRDNVAVPAPEPVEISSGVRVVSIAERFIGTPYRYGGDDPEKGFDCSGLVFYSFEQLGLKVPRTAADQRRAAERVTRSSLEPGDLVFFRSSKGRVDHVGIYAGEGRFIHAPSSGHVVSYGYLDDPYYRTHFVSAGRLPSKI